MAAGKADANYLEGWTGTTFPGKGSDAAVSVSLPPERVAGLVEDLPRHGAALLPARSLRPGEDRLASRVSGHGRVFPVGCFARRGNGA